MAETSPPEENSLLQEVQRRSGTSVSACYQCHKCSTGCPLAPEMDWRASQVIRLIHWGQEREVLQSRAIWLCASCQACTARCPMDIDIAGVMDTLRMMAVERAVALGDTRGEKFNRSFLTSVRRHGRVFEMGMLTAYKLRSGQLLADLDKVPKMLAKGKLALFPHPSQDAPRMRPIFRRADQEDRTP